MRSPAPMSDLCGTPTGRERHRRRREPVCEPCRVAHNAAQREQRAARRSILGPVPRRVGSAEPILCGGCGLEVEACDGLDNDWMHTVGRSERCRSGELAYPETPRQREWRIGRRSA